MVGGANLLLKTLALRSFHIIKVASMDMEDMAFRFSIALHNMSFHHSLREV
jgi:hypothetical protein